MKQYINKEYRRYDVEKLNKDMYKYKRDASKVCTSKVLINKKQLEQLENPNQLTRIKNILSDVLHPIKTTWQFKSCQDKILTDYNSMTDLYRYTEDNGPTIEEYEGVMNQEIEFKESDRIAYEKKQLLEQHAKEIQRTKEVDYDLYVSNNIYY